MSVTIVFLTALLAMSGALRPENAYRSGPGAGPSLPTATTMKSAQADNTYGGGPG